MMQVSAKAEKPKLSPPQHDAWRKLDSEYRTANMLGVNESSLMALVTKGLAEVHYMPNNAAAFRKK